MMSTEEQHQATLSLGIDAGTINEIPTSPDTPPPADDVVLDVDFERPSGELFRLMNIHLVDSLSKGRLQTMGIDGGTALTGRNGQGKTSLLSLVLLFIGVEPTALVSRGKDSFIEYYLPNPTSYIAFEYERPDGGRRMVVAYGNTSGDKVYFRFVKHGFLREMFVNEDEQFVLTKDFRRRLSELTISCADRQVETYQDYRCIIQYWQPAHADSNHRRYLLGMSDDYGFTKYRQPLRHLEKLIRGMFSRQADFDDLRQVVSDWVFEGKPSVGIHTERSKVETWPRDHRAYKEIMGIEPLVEGAQQVVREIDATLEGISEIKEKFLFLQDHLTESLAARRAEETGLQGQLTEAQENHSARANEIQGRLTSLDIRIKHHEEQLAAIETKRADFASQDIDHKRSRTGQLEIFKNDLASAQAQLNLLQGAYNDISARYERLINEEESRLVSVERAANNNQSSVMAGLHRELTLLQGTLKIDLEDLAEELKPEESRLSEIVSQLNQEVGSARNRVERPSDDPEILQLIELKDAEITEANHTAATLQLAVHAHDKEANSGQTSVDKAEENITAIDKKISAQHASIQEIERAHSPEPDSLLHFLRANHPEWVGNVAKVINPALLQRSDLTPQLAAVADSFYGIELDLDVLDATGAADQSKLEQLLEDAETELAVLHSNREAAVERRDQALVALKLQKDELSKVRTQLYAVNSKSQTLSGDRAHLVNRQREERQHAKKLAEAALSQIQADLKQAQDAFEAFQRSGTQRRETLHTQNDAKRKRLSEDSAQKVASIQDSVRLQSIATARAVEELRENQNKDLKGAGADVDVIGGLEAKIKILQKSIQDIDGWRELISQWQYWHENVEKTEPALLEGKAALAVSLVEEQATLSDQNAQWVRLKQEINSSISTCVEIIRSLSDERDIVNSALSRELEFYSATDLYTQYDQSWQTGSLRSSLHEKQMEVRRSLKTLGGQVDTMEAAFSRVPNSPPCDYFQDRLANVRYESNIEVTHRIKLQVIEEWFSTHHEKSRRILIADGHTIFGDIQDLHRDLKKFTDKITRFNTALQNHLSHSSKVFDSIKDLQVSIFSAVEDLDYWTVISKISTARDEWMRPDELPDDESVENLRLLLQNWDIKNGIQADFKSLVSIRGSVREKGNLRYFKSKADLENISSNGLSYLILIILFLGFISKVRGQAPVQLTWCVDELKAIDADNVISLCNYLGQNFITLCTAFPDPDAETLILFENKYKLDSERRLVHCELAVEEGLDEDEEYELELEDV